MLELTNYLSYVSNMFHLISKHKRLTYINLWYLYQLIYTELLANGPDELKHVGDITKMFFDILLTVHLSIFISVINQLDAQNFCFTISLLHASTCFEHMCSSSGGQNCITQPLVSSHL